MQRSGVFSRRGPQVPTATLTSSGRITLPKEVRDRLNLKAGDYVEFVDDPAGGYRLLQARRDIQELRGLLRPPPRPVSLDEMDRAVARAVARRLSRGVKRS
jgi:AbrB family looped-hinge helix DNA binding protein